MTCRRIGGPAPIAGPLLLLAFLASIAAPPARATDWIPPTRLTALLPGATLAPNSVHTLSLVVRANGVGGTFAWTAESAGPFSVSVTPSGGLIAVPSNGIATVNLSVALPDSAVGTSSVRVDINQEIGGARLARVAVAIQAATGGRPEVIPVPSVWTAPAGTSGNVAFQIHSSIGVSDSIALTTGRFNPDSNNEGGVFAGAAATSPITLSGGATLTVNVPTTMPGGAYAGNANVVQLSVSSEGGISNAVGYALVSAVLPDSLPTALVPVGLTPVEVPAAGRDGAAFLASHGDWLLPCGPDGVRVLRASSTDSIGLIDGDANGADDRLVGVIRIPAFAAALSVLPGFVTAAGETLDVGLLAAGDAGLMVLDLRMVETPTFGPWEDFFDTDGNGIDDRILRTIPTPGFATDAAWVRAPSGRCVALVADADLGGNPVAAGYDPAQAIAGSGAGILAIDVGAALDSLGPLPYAAGSLATPGSALDIEVRGGSASREMILADGSGGVALYALSVSSGAPALVTFTPRGSVALSGAWGTPDARDIAWVANTGDSTYAAVAAGAGGIQIVRAPRATGAPVLVLAQQTAAPAVGAASAWTGALAAAMRSGGVALLRSPGAAELDKIAPGAPAPYAAPVNLGRGQAWGVSGVLERGLHRSWLTSATSLCFRETGGTTPSILVSDGARLLVLRSGAGTITAVDVAAAPPRAAPTLRASPNPSAGGLWLEASGPGGGPLRIGIFDARGRMIRVLHAGGAGGAGAGGDVGAGGAAIMTRVRWDGRDERGRAVASGRYWGRVLGTGKAGDRPGSATAITLVR